MCSGSTVAYIVTIIWLTNLFPQGAPVSCDGGFLTHVSCCSGLQWTQSLSRTLDMRWAWSTQWIKDRFITPTADQVWSDLVFGSLTIALFLFIISSNHLRAFVTVLMSRKTEFCCNLNTWLCPVTCGETIVAFLHTPFLWLISVSIDFNNNVNLWRSRTSLPQSLTIEDVSLFASMPKSSSSGNDLKINQYLLINPESKI